MLHMRSLQHRFYAWRAAKAAGRSSPLDCLSFSGGLGRSIAIRFTVVRAAINSAGQKAASKIPKIQRGNGVVTVPSITVAFFAGF